MKKNISKSLILIFSIIIYNFFVYEMAYSTSNFKNEVIALKKSSSEYENIFDIHGYMNKDEKDRLQTRIDKIKDKYNYEVVLLMYDDVLYEQRVAYTDDFFDYNEFAFENGYDGMILLLNMDGRFYYTSTSGFGITAFTDKGLDHLEAHIKDLASNGKYYELFDEYLDKVDELLRMANEGNVFVGTPVTFMGQFGILSFLISIVISIIGSFGLLTFEKNKMKTSILQTGAGSYLGKQNVNITRSSDMFLRTFITKTKIEKESSSGSSTHIGSSGRSHGGSRGSGRF